MTKEVWTEGLQNKAKKLELSLRKLVHAPNCQDGIKSNYRQCPQECTCNPELNDTTALLWEAASILRMARASENPELLQGIRSALRFAACVAMYHHSCEPNMPRQLIDASDLVSAVYENALATKEPS